MFNSFSLILMSLIFMSILLFNFSRNKHINTIELKLYNILLYINIFGLILEMLCFCSIKFLSKGNFLTLLINKVFLNYYILFMIIFIIYVLVISMEINKFIKNKKKIKLIAIFVFLIFSFMVYILPLNLNYGQKIYSYGPAVVTVYIYSFIILLFCIIILLKNFKYIKSKKYLPIIIFIIGSGIVGYIQTIKPELTLNTIIESVVLFIMYFTIENPDVKMIQQLELAKDTAEKANRAKSDFLSSMSHEIRTPLNAIVGLSDDILTYDNVPDEVKEDSKDIVEASHTLLEIVGNILDINKIESEKMKIVENVYNFKEELISIAKINKVRIGNKPIQYNVNIAEDIPNYLYGDKTHIKQILNNLISNAIKYTDEGYINISAKCINNNDTCLLIISVQDTGRGIKAEDIGKLFTKFERLDIEKNSTTEGTGLGLAITKKLVELMNGKINVSSSYKKGSIFMVQLPQRIYKKEMPDTNIKSKEEIKENFKNKKVLIVDDNALNIKVAKIALRDFEMEIDECYDGLSCLEKVKEKKYDIILMDIMMPEMSGETALIKLKEMPGFNTPVIALTADAITGAKEKYIEEGFADYIAKPFKKEEIKEKLDNIFNK